MILNKVVFNFIFKVNVGEYCVSVYVSVCVLRKKVSRSGKMEDKVEMSDGVLFFEEVGGDGF